MRFRPFILRTPLLVAALLLISTAANAQSLVLAWDASTTTGVSGYRVHYGTTPSTYPNSIDVGTQTTYTVSGLVPGVRYYFVVSAYSAGGTSNYSNEVSGVATGFTDSTLTAGITTIRAVHILELRLRIDALRVRQGLPAQTWTNPTLTGQVVRSVHITELRTALAAVYQNLGRVAPFYTDSNLVSGATFMKAVHITELRQAIMAVE
jgi:hypothetical protein